ncbi:hypothetical protein I6N95_05160 [Vagococcus sp. BWB3-3]|uniref:Uncharacterized protein n=1 Tax=Vagococcus allomyrinae TaxID=2794353 RepID=A0A940P2R8_9ENTE|nr:hypothetical protein [Vagococcus allomyrinae]MBP1040399.1 hypothetical protein [Vagococcus allomyrinae]
MFNETTQEQVAASIELLEERGYQITSQNDYEERGYHIETHCIANGKNECFKPKDGSLYKFLCKNGHFCWDPVVRLPYRKPKKDYVSEGYKILNEHAKK